MGFFCREIAALAVCGAILNVKFSITVTEYYQKTLELMIRRRQRLNKNIGLGTYFLHSTPYHVLYQIRLSIAFNPIPTCKNRPKKSAK